MQTRRGLGWEQSVERKVDSDRLRRGQHESSPRIGLKRAGNPKVKRKR
jgi:hypothetical protein